jgi:hypothetical protein
MVVEPEVPSPSSAGKDEKIRDDARIAQTLDDRLRRLQNMSAKATRPEPFLGVSNSCDGLVIAPFLESCIAVGSAPFLLAATVGLVPRWFQDFKPELGQSP